MLYTASIVSAMAILLPLSATASPIVQDTATDVDGLKVVDPEDPDLSQPTFNASTNLNASSLDFGAPSGSRPFEFYLSSGLQHIAKLDRSIYENNLRIIKAMPYQGGSSSSAADFLSLKIYHGPQGQNSTWNSRDRGLEALTQWSDRKDRRLDHTGWAPISQSELRKMTLAQAITKLRSRGWKDQFKAVIIGKFAKASIGHKNELFYAFRRDHDGASSLSNWVYLGAQSGDTGPDENPYNVIQRQTVVEAVS